MTNDDEDDIALEIVVSNPAVQGKSNSEAVIYVGTAASPCLNTLVIDLRNISDGDIQLPAYKDKQPQFTLDFTDFQIDTSRIKAGTLPDGWSLGVAASVINLTYAGSSATWEDKNTLTFTISGIVASLDPTQNLQETIRLRPVNIPEFGDGETLYWDDPALTILAAPTGERKDLKMQVNFTEPEDGTGQPELSLVYISPPGGEADIPNTLTFTLANLGDGIQKGTLQICLECGNGPGDLIPLSKDGIPIQGSLTLAVTNDYGKSWKPHDEPLYNNGLLTWTPESETDTLLPEGDDGKVELTLSGIVTTLKPGETLLHITFKGMDNYNDASYVLPIQKVQIDYTFTVTPNVFYPELIPLPQDVYIVWNVKNSEIQSVSIEYDGKVTPQFDPIQGTLPNDSVPVVSVQDPRSIKMRLFGGRIKVPPSPPVSKRVISALPVNHLDVGDPLPSQSPMVFTPDGTRALITNYLDNTISVITLGKENEIDFRQTPKTISVGHGPWSVAITQDGTRALVTNAWDNTISVVALREQIKDDQRPQTIDVGFNTPISVAITPDGTRVLVGNDGNDKISVIQLGEGIDNAQIPHTIDVGSSPYAIAITPDGARAVVTNNGDDTISVITLGEKNDYSQTLQTIQVGYFPTSVAITPDGKRALVINQGPIQPNAGDWFISIVSLGDEIDSSQKPKTIEVGIVPTAVAITPDGSLALVLNDSSILVLTLGDEIDSSQTLKTIAGPAGPLAMAISPDGKLVLALGAGGTLSVIEISEIK